MKRKILSLALAIAMLTTLWVPVSFAEGETVAPITKTMVNVAQNKYVYSGGGNAGPSGAAQMLTDGRKSTGAGNEANKIGFNPNTTANDYSGKLPSGAQGTVSTAGTNDWFMIDLGRQFKVKEVILYAPSAPDETATINSNQAGYMANVEIQGSNTEDFASYDTLLDIEGNATWDHYPYYAVTQSEVKPYRYIRLQKTGVGYYGFSEMEVLADVTVSEVSRNKKANFDLSAADGYVETAATDGVETTIGWENTDTSATAKYMVLDLEKEYPVSWIEMVSGPYGTACNYWSVYGSVTAPTAATLTTTGSLLFPTLFSSTAASGYTSNYGTLHPVYPGMLSMATYNIGKTRYITLYKSTERVQLREVRAFVMHPEVYDVAVGDTISVSFSDTMNTSTLSASTISLTNVTTGAAIDLTGKLTVSASGVVISDVTLPEDNEFALKVTTGAENAQGIGLAADYTYEFDTYRAPYEVPYTKTVNRNVAINKFVYSGGGNAGPTGAAQMLTDGRKSTGSGQEATYIGIGPNTTLNDYSGVLPSKNKTATQVTGNNDDWFMIDLGRQFNVTEVRLYASLAEIGSASRYMSNIQVQGSNTETFDDYSTLISIGTATAENFPYTAAVLDNAKTFRYIRVQKTALSEYGISELEVYADVNLTEVSRGKKVTASTETYPSDYPITETVDGIVGVGANAWLVEGGTAPHYMILDLGEELPVSWIEMEGRAITANENVATRYNWSVYGSVSEPTAETLTTGSLLFPKLLALYADGVNKYTTNYQTLFPAYPNMLSMPVYDNGIDRTIGNTRYLTFYKTAGNVALSEVRAFVTAPELISAYGADGTVTLTFSEAMKADTLNTRSIKLYDSENNEVAWTTGSLSGNSFTISGLSLTEDATYKVVVNNLAENTKGVMVAPWNEDTFVNTADYTIEGFSFVDSEGTAITEALSKAADDVNLSVSVETNGKPVEIMLTLAFYKGSELEEVKVIKTTVAGGTTDILKLSKAWTEETAITKVKAFIWDENMVPYAANLEVAVQ